MIEVLILVTASIICFAAANTYSRSRDPLAPMIIFAPMLLYIYVYRPWTLILSGSVESYFPDLSSLIVVHTLNLLVLAAFCVGCSTGARRIPITQDRRFRLVNRPLTPRIRALLLRTALVLGVISCTVFWSSVWYSGGPTRVFSSAKPFLQSPIRSGYFSELDMLTFPSLLLMATAWQGKGLNVGKVLLILFVASPHLVMGTIGGRRGPAFLIACTFVACWCIIRSRRPNLRWTIAGLGAIGLLLILLSEHRGRLFQPWYNEVELTVLNDKLAGTDASAGDEYIGACALVLTSREHGRYYFGKRYFTTFFVRPIPRQIWPTKYVDLGLEWMVSHPGSSGFSTSEWMDAVGFEAVGGTACGFVADLFLEFAWGAVVGGYLIGRLYSLVWLRWTTRGGFWTILYFEMLVLSVFLPSQSVGAWFHRLMLLGIPSWFIWAKIIQPNLRRSRAARPLRAFHPQAPRTLENNGT